LRGSSVLVVPVTVVDERSRSVAGALWLLLKVLQLVQTRM